MARGWRLPAPGTATGTCGRSGATAPVSLQLTDYGDEHHYVRNPEWSPTGDRLVYEFASFAGNVWTIRIR